MTTTVRPTDPRLAEAVSYAAIVHADQCRKGTDVPYISHLLQVAGLVIEHGGEPATAVAAVLHDAAEDCGGIPRLADIRLRFGDRVADLVRACSDSLAPAGATKAPWRERKEAYLQHLEVGDSEALLIAVADKLHNARSTVTDLLVLDPATVWSKFKAPPADQLWFLDTVVAIARRRGAAPALVASLAETVAALRRHVA